MVAPVEVPQPSACEEDTVCSGGDVHHRGGALEEKIADIPEAAMPAKERASVRDVLEEVHGKRVCKPQDALAIVGALACIAVAAWLITLVGDDLVDFAEWLVDLGAAGHLLFFGLFVWVGLPFGYNWSTLCVLVGFAYGWVGLLDIYFGTVCSSTFTFFMSRRCCGGCVSSRLGALGKKKRMYLKAAKMVMESRRAGFLMLVVFRVNPVLTFGMENAMFGAWLSVPIWKLAVTTFLGTQYGAMSMTNMGILVRELGSLKTATASTASSWPLIIQIAAFCILFVGGSMYLRYLTIRVLPGMIDEDAVVELEDDLPENRQASGEQQTGG